MKQTYERRVTTLANELARATQASRREHAARDHRFARARSARRTFFAAHGRKR